MSKIKNMQGNSGPVANQFIIEEEGHGAHGKCVDAIELSRKDG